MSKHIQFETRQPLLFIFLGLPGSGKTHFAQQLSRELGVVRLNSDSMRMAIFGSREKTREIYQSGDRVILNSYVFNAMDYATEELLASGQSVIQDANHNQRINRKNLERLASEQGGRVVLICIKTPRELAAQRAQERVETKSQRRLTSAEVLEVYERHTKNTDQPDESELVIEIDGAKEFKDQFASFVRQMEQIDE